MNDKLFVRGPQNSPIIIIGDSLPANETTRNELKEVLDRRHVIYKSIILPLKYYLNDYLYKNTKGKYRLPLEDGEDIFRYMNAILNFYDKWSLDLNSNKGMSAINQLKKELFKEDGSERYKLIICLGDFSYFMIKGVFNEHETRRCKYVSKTSKVKYTIIDMGNEFRQRIESYNPEKCLILPILHNSSNLRFSHSDNFINLNNYEENKYDSYLQYIAEKIVDIMLIDEGIKKWLMKTSN